MKRLSSWTLMMGEPGAKVALIFAAGIAALLALYGFGYVPDPWNSHGRGPGWECDITRAGASVCQKDVPPAMQKPK